MAAYDNWIARNAARRNEEAQLWDSRSALEKEKAMGGVTDESGPIGEGVAKTDWLGNSNLTQNEAPSNEASVGKPGASGKEAAMAGMAQQAAQGGSLLDVAGSGGTMAGLAGVGMKSGMNPYLLGAGLGLTALSSIQKKKQQNEQNRYLAEMQKYNARQNAIQNLAQIGQNLKA